jgi:hypothetical protein
MAVTGAFADVVRRAHRESSFRGRLVYFPDEVIAEYGLTGAEAKAVTNCDLAGVAFTEADEALRIEAENVFNLHDLFAGE